PTFLSLRCFASWRLVLLIVLVVTPAPREGEAPAEPLPRHKTAGSAGASPSQAALAKACEYLWSQQSEDGGWHSAQYGVMRSGESLTPFVLHALLQVPESVYPRPHQQMERALDFIRDHVEGHGSLGHGDPDLVEYPVYSTAYALRCLLEAHGSFEFEV